MNFIRTLFAMQISRFIFMGALSTATMFGIYVALNLILNYQISYLISYVLTVVFSYVLNTRYVFKIPMSWKTFLQFPFVYVVQYVGSAIGLEVLVRFGFSVTMAPLITIVLLLPVTFFLSRLIMAKKLPRN